MKSNEIIFFCLLGIVDQVHDETVSIELSFTSQKNVYRTETHLPLWIFPCKISEGSRLYFTNKDEKIQLICEL